MDFLAWHGGRGKQGKRRAGRRMLPANRHRLLFEPLEDRTLLSVTVNPITGPETGGAYDVPSGKNLYVPVTGTDVGQTITYTATSSDPAVTVSVLSGNPTIQMTVHGTTAGSVAFSGTMTFQLFANIAPATVAGIVSKVNAGLFDGSSFYRAETGASFQLVQGGIEKTPGKTDPQVLPDEFNVAAAFNSPGLMAMASAGPGTAKSEFFVTALNRKLSQTPQVLNFGYTIFGQILTGLDIYNDILNIPTTANAQGIHYANTPVTIDSASVITETQNGVLQISEPNNYNGSTTITVTGTGSDVTSAQQTFTVVGAPFSTAAGNAPPLFLHPVANLTTSQDKPITFILAATQNLSTGSARFSVSGVSSFNGAPLNIATPTGTPGDNNTVTVTLTPNAGFNGTVNLVAHVDNDTNGVHDAEAFSLTVFTKLVPTTEPPAATLAGSPFGFAVSVEDQSGVVQTSFSGNVTVAITPGTGPTGGALGGTLTAPVINGVATFSGLTLNHSGSYTLDVTSGTVTAGTTTSITVNDNLVVTAQPPASVVAASPFNMTVTAKDSLGNPDTAFNGNVTVAVLNNPGTSTLSGTVTAQAVNGVASFSNLKLNHFGVGYTLQATSGTMTAGASGAFNVIDNLAVQTPPPNIVLKNQAFSATIVAQDAESNLDTAFNGNVNVTLGAGSPSATLGGTLTVQAASGVSTFSSLTLNAIGVGYTLHGIAGSSQITTSSFEVRDQLVVTSQPLDLVAAGSPFQVTVTAKDGLGNVDTTFSGNVTIALADNPGSTTLGGTLSVPVINGVGTFSNLTLNKAAVGYTLQVSGVSLVSATTDIIDIKAAAATQLVLATQPPGTAPVGSAFGLAVLAKDQFGNVDISFNGPVTVAVHDNPSGGTLGGTLIVNAVHGAAIFSGLTLDTPGVGYTLATTSGDLTQGITEPITAISTQLVVTTQPPGSVPAGSAFGFVVSVEDNANSVVSTFNGNVTVAITSGTGTSGATLSGTLSVPVTNGVATFTGLTLDKVGTGYTLHVTGGIPTPVNTSSIAVTPTQLVVTAQPPVTTVAGSPFGFVASIEDDENSVITTFNGNVTVAITSGTGTSGATLGGTLSVPVINGVATFSNLTLDKVGTGYTLHVTSGIPTPVTTNSIAVTIAAPAKVVVTLPPPGTTGAGAPFGFAASVEDPSGNVETTFNGQVTVAITTGTGPAGATLGGTLVATAINGVATFSGLTLNKAGTGTTLTATSGTLTSGVTSAISVTPAAASQVVITTQPSSTIQAGSPFGFSATVEDQFGNAVTSFNGGVAVAITTGTGTSGAVLHGILTATASGGVANFSNLSINQAGTGYTLTASTGTLNSGITGAISVTTAAASQVLITTQPAASVQAGSAFNTIVKVEDQFGNVATSFSGTVAVAITAGTGPSGGTLGGTVSMAATSGVANFSNLTLNKAGSGTTLTATSGTLTPAISSAISVTPAATSQFVVTTPPPGSVLAGNSFGFAVSAEDAFGNVDSSFTGSVTVAITSGTGPNGATLGGTLTVTAVSGVASFSGLTLNKAGAGYTLHVTGGTLSAATTSAITVTPAATSKLVVTTQPPATIASGSPFGFAVTAEDQFGNIETSFTSAVTVSITSGTGPTGAPLNGTFTVTAVSGVATFSGLNLSTPGLGYTLSTFSGTLTSATTSAINVTAVANATLSGFVYVDLGKDGTKDGTDPVVPDVPIALTGTDDLGSPVSQSTSTLSDGSFEFTGLRAGLYTITETQPSYLMNGSPNVISGIQLTTSQDNSGLSLSELGLLPNLITIDLFLNSLPSAQDVYNHYANSAATSAASNAIASARGASANTASAIAQPLAASSASSGNDAGASPLAAVAGGLSSAAAGAQATPGASALVGSSLAAGQSQAGSSGAAAAQPAAASGAAQSSGQLAAGSGNDSQAADQALASEDSWTPEVDVAHV